MGVAAGGKQGTRAGRQLSRHEVRSRRHGISKWKTGDMLAARRPPRKREREAVIA